MKRFLVLFIALMVFIASLEAQSFVEVKGHQLFHNSKPYYFMGTNYWYGSLLALHTDPMRGVERLRKELDFLQRNGVTNLRIMAGAEGSGKIIGVERVRPALQMEKGIFDTAVLRGLDILLTEMGKRNMKAVIFFSNNWEWSGGFLQYLRWNDKITDSLFRAHMDWNTMQDVISRFYSCTPCKEDYRKQVELVLGRINSINGIPYKSDPAIMAWELANEPRPMRPEANEAYRGWIVSTTAYIKTIDKNHLVTLGHEGEIGTQSMELYEAIHRDSQIDYLTIHIWPRNWGWYKRDALKEAIPDVIQKTKEYMEKHISLAQKLKRPLVIEEFGLPRDGDAFSPGTPTSLRDQFYRFVFDVWRQHALHNGVVAGTNFWAFNGVARPKPGQTFWKPGDDFMGDPPMEEQSLYGVFDNDTTTWKLIREAIKKKR